MTGPRQFNPSRLPGRLSRDMSLGSISRQT